MGLVVRWDAAGLSQRKAKVHFLKIQESSWLMWWVIWAELTHSPVHTHGMVLVISISLGNFQKKKIMRR